jgi:chromosome segregation ATPase
LKFFSVSLPNSNRNLSEESDLISALQAQQREEEGLLQQLKENRNALELEIRNLTLKKDQKIDLEAELGRLSDLANSLSAQLQEETERREDAERLRDEAVRKEKEAQETISKEVDDERRSQLKKEKDLKAEVDDLALQLKVAEEQKELLERGMKEKEDIESNLRHEIDALRSQLNAAKNRMEAEESGKEREALQRESEEKVKGERDREIQNEIESLKVLRDINMEGGSMYLRIFSKENVGEWNIRRRILFK